jgi:hypothetical protein
LETHKPIRDSETGDDQPSASPPRKQHLFNGLLRGLEKRVERKEVSTNIQLLQISTYLYVSPPILGDHQETHQSAIQLLPSPQTHETRLRISVGWANFSCRASFHGAGLFPGHLWMVCRPRISGKSALAATEAGDFPVEATVANHLGRMSIESIVGDVLTNCEGTPNQSRWDARHRPNDVGTT